ncbi:hypothetical protein HIM_06333 [Hirsutella minnesotensis 3608]|uniref:MARVEL domain-containing protein n=1 Tax=Hirsutella minnesotensis 3608 TaxID=1043627 RepID=A0A0F7ZZJ4_9HYPO|nr:hypothetical protein HIM_06333 [Hirsutella minnesotensis 3608]
MALSLTKSWFFFSALHLVCLALALTICGIYGSYAHYDNGTKKFIYAIVVASLSAVTSVVYFLPPVVRRASLFAAIWNMILFILWIIAFAIFAVVWLKYAPNQTRHIARMRSAVWVDLANALLWLISSLAMFGYWWKHRDTRSQFTGRAHV